MVQSKETDSRFTCTGGSKHGRHRPHPRSSDELRRDPSVGSRLIMRLWLVIGRSEFHFLTRIPQREIRRSLTKNDEAASATVDCYFSQKDMRVHTVERSINTSSQALFQLIFATAFCHFNPTDTSIRKRLFHTPTTAKMYSGLFTAVSVLALSALSFAEPVPQYAAATPTSVKLEECPVRTVTTTPTCTGIFNCPLERPCTATVTATKECGGPGPVCSPAPTPTITVTAACTPPCRACEFTSTTTVCSFF